MSGPRSLTLVLVVATSGVGSLPGCRPAAPSGPARPAAVPAMTTSTSALRDWVLYPEVANDEAAGKCARLVSAAPNVTEICCALGLAGCLVGRTRYCTYPPSVERVPSIGALNDLNVEALLGLAPDLVLVSGASRAITERLSRLGLRFETAPDVSLADLFASIEEVGALTGRKETARLLVEGLHTDLAAVAARLACRPKVHVLLLTAPLPDPPARVDAAGPGSFYDDLLRLAGHANAVEAPAGAFAPLALEFVLRADPDVIIELVADPSLRPAGDADAIRVWSKVGSIKAVTEGRVHVLVGAQYFVLGPRIARTFEALCELISGDRHE